MKIRMKLNKDEVNILSELNCAITGKPLEMVNETTTDLISTSTSYIYNNGELLYMVNFEPEYVVDILTKIKELAAMINPVAKRINEMFKEFNDKWMKKPKDVQTAADLLALGYRYKAETRNGKIYYLTETNRIFVEPTTLLPLYNILYIIDLESGKDITKDVFSSIVQKVLEKQNNKE